MAGRLLIVACVLTLCLAGCEEENAFYGFLDDIEVKLLEGSIVVDYMPVVPPDPVSCRLTLLVRNTSTSASAVGLFLPEAVIARDSSGEPLGIFTLASEWDGRLGPGEADTVRLTKIGSSAPLPTLRCGEEVDVSVTLRNPSLTSRQIFLDAITVYCIY